VPKVSDRTSFRRNEDPEKVPAASNSKRLITCHNFVRDYRTDLVSYISRMLLSNGQAPSEDKVVCGGKSQTLLSGVLYTLKSWLQEFEQCGQVFSAEDSERGREAAGEFYRRATEERCREAAGEFYSKATAKYSEALQHDGFSPRLYTNRAASLIMERRHVSALRDCLCAMWASVQTQQNHFKAYARACRTLLALGYLPLASSMCSTVLRMIDGPDNGFSSGEKATLRKQLSEVMGEVAAAEKLCTKLRHPHSKNMPPDQQLRMLDSILKYSKHSTYWQERKASVLLKRHCWNDTVRFVGVVSKHHVLLDLSPRGRDLIVGYGHRPSCVLAVCCPSLLTFYVQALWYSGSEDQALSDAESALQFLEDDGRVRFELEKEVRKRKSMLRMKADGNDLFRRALYPEAFQRYTEALGVDDLSKEFNAKIRCNRAATSMATENYYKAIKDCNHCLELRPNYWKAHLRRARSYVATRNFDSAAQDFQAFLDKTESEALEGNQREEVWEELRQARMMSQAKKREHARKQAEAKHARWGQAQNQYDQWYEKERARNDTYTYGSKRSSRQSSYQSGGGASSSSSHNYRQNGTRIPKQPSRSAKPRSPSLYEKLGVAHTATAGEIKKAYHKLALKFHPDKCTGDKKVAEEKFKEIANAHNTLSNKEERSVYDLERRFTGVRV
jgi:hypothetical protein